MKKSIFKEKYPIWTLEMSKDKMKITDMDNIISYFLNKIEEHPIAKYLVTFDHIEHTKSLDEHSINPSIKDIKNIIFCFGKEIPNTKVAAVRPRSIAICELEDRFMIEFLEAPNEKLHNVMESWAKGLLK
jgi:hypothetical protein